MTIIIWSIIIMFQWLLTFECEEFVNKKTHGFNINPWQAPIDYEHLYWPCAPIDYEELFIMYVYINDITEHPILPLIVLQFIIMELSNNRGIFQANYYSQNN